VVLGVLLVGFRSYTIPECWCVFRICIYTRIGVCVITLYKKRVRPGWTELMVVVFSVIVGGSNLGRSSIQYCSFCVSQGVISMVCAKLSELGCRGFRTAVCIHLYMPYPMRAVITRVVPTICQFISHCISRDLCPSPCGVWWCMILFQDGCEDVAVAVDPVSRRLDWGHQGCWPASPCQCDRIFYIVLLS